MIYACVRFCKGNVYVVKVRCDPVTLASNMCVSHAMHET